jgi:Putative Flp pilus-assembly TadE/G-like
MAATFSSLPGATAMLARLVRDDVDGVVLPYVVMTLAVVIGVAALALDGSRLMSVQSQLQNGADALALAGAAELDRRPDSIIRAEAAIRNLLNNPVSGAGVGQVAKVNSIEFLSSLPVDDNLPITTRNTTEDPTLAAYVQVSVEPIHLQTIFPVSLSAGQQNVSVGAQAVAGYDQVVCNASPIFVCNPFETSGMSYYQATQALVAADQNPAAHRQLMRLTRSQSQNGGYGAGNFGYVAPATGYFPTSACGPGGGRGIPQAMAATQVRACFRLSGINLISGDDQSAIDGLNTRLDIYARGFSSCRIYPPDLNVRKGFIALGNVNWCNAVPAASNWPMPTPDAAALPLDQNMINLATQSLDPNATIGNGIWNCAAYWSTAHFAGPGKNAPPPGCSAAATISRYDLYRYEINFLNDRSRGVEYGAPQCAPPGVANRRIITVPIINCGSSPVPVLSDAQNVPVAGFGKFFLVLPAQPGTNGNPYAEFVGLVKRSDPLSTDVVQLNR